MHIDVGSGARHPDHDNRLHCQIEPAGRTAESHNDSADTVQHSSHPSASDIPPVPLPSDIPNVQLPKDIPRVQLPSDIPHVELPAEIPRVQLPSDIPPNPFP